MQSLEQILHQVTMWKTWNAINLFYSALYLSIEKWLLFYWKRGRRNWLMRELARSSLRQTSFKILFLHITFVRKLIVEMHKLDAISLDTDETRFKLTPPSAHFEVSRPSRLQSTRSLFWPLQPLKWTWNSFWPWNELDSVSTDVWQASLNQLGRSIFSQSRSSSICSILL